MLPLQNIIGFLRDQSLQKPIAITLKHLTSSDTIFMKIISKYFFQQTVQELIILRIFYRCVHTQK